MKKQMMKCTRWLYWRGRLILVPAAMLFLVLAAQAQTDVILPPIGGTGGGQFSDGRCPQGQLLTGFKLRAGDWVDAIRPICVIAYGSAEVAPNPLEAIYAVYPPPMFGGSGGNPRQLVCPSDAPIVIGMDIKAEGLHVINVNHIHLWCGMAAATQSLSALPNAVFDGVNAYHEGDVFTDYRGIKHVGDRQDCPAGLVAVGINGRHGEWLDSLGLICGAPKLTPKPAPPPEVPPRPVVKAVGRTRTGAPTGPPTNTPPRPICDVARGARARNSPAAAGLEESCRAELAAKGAAIAQVDPIVAAARAAETDAQYQQGFDIATGIFGDPALGANGNTATGPGSLGIRDALSAAGQRGFNASVKLHLSRNYRGTSTPSAGTITANPNPVTVPNGQTSGTTTISWKVPQGYSYCEIYLSVDNGQWSEFARGGDGSKPTTIKLSSSQAFRMMIYEGQAGTPKVITTLTVTAAKIKEEVNETASDETQTMVAMARPLDLLGGCDVVSSSFGASSGWDVSQSDRRHRGESVY